MGGAGADDRDTQFAQDVNNLVSDAALYRDNLSADRITAMRYFNGEMVDLPPRKGWSEVVSLDLRATIKKVLPSMMRTILGNEIVGEFTGENEDDVEGAEQATDYINLVVFPESKGEKAIHDAIHDACLLRNGILYAGIEHKTVVTGSTHTGLDEISLSKLVNDDEVEIISARKYPDPDPVAPESLMSPDMMAQPSPQMPPQGPQMGMPADPNGQQAPVMPMAPMPPIEPPMLYNSSLARRVCLTKG